MKNLIIALNLLFLIIPLYVQAHFPTNAVWVEDLNHFRNKDVAVVWRGTHFLKNIFPTSPERRSHWDQQVVGEPIYAAGAYREAAIPLTHHPTARQKELLYTKSRRIQTCISSMYQSGPITINSHVFENHRYAFQNLYSNDYNTFRKVVSPTEVPPKYGPLVAGLNLDGNPFISCSSAPKQAVKYALGLKNYGNQAQTLSPSYDTEGRPRNPFLGIFYGIVLDQPMLQETLAFNVPAHHRRGHIYISTHYTCNILSEEEISFVGRIPPKACAVKYPMTAPSFEGDYTPDVHLETYGLTKTRYNNIKSLLTDAATPKQAKEKKVHDMLEKIASPTKYKHKAHQKTPGYKIRRQIKDCLEDIDASCKKIGEDGALH